jgi:phage gp36-like protein
MFLTSPELKSVLYEYQLNEITEESPDIAEMAINAAVEEMKSYLSPTGQARWRDGRPRYDVAAIFAALGSERNALILELSKSIALYYVCRLANVDIMQERVQERYDRAIDWLEKVAGVGKYANAPSIAPNLPLLPAGDEETALQAFRFGSREKFNHDF